MTIPDFQSIMLPLLQLAADGQIHAMADSREVLADHFALTDDERQERLPSRKQRKFANRVAWAKSYLAKALLLDTPKRAHFCITDRGHEVLRNPPERIDTAFLSQYEEFRDFRNRRARDPIPPGPGGPDDQTPEEQLQSAYERIQADLAEDLLTHVKAMTPSAFEGLVVDLMTQMGYGGSRMGSGATTNPGADEGIDGIINEDRLGLDVIYLQAKHWENPVGRPEIQKFVGALHGKRARKGVFLTTSRFTDDADDYVQHIDPKVVLIDGHELARLRKSRRQVGS